MLRHAALLIALQVVQLVCCRLSSAQVLDGGSIDQTDSSQHAGDGGAALSDCAQLAGLSRSRSAAYGAVNLMLVGVIKAPRGSQLVGAIKEREAVCL